MNDSSDSENKFNDSSMIKSLYPDELWEAKADLKLESQRKQLIKALAYAAQGASQQAISLLQSLTSQQSAWSDWIFVELCLIAPTLKLDLATSTDEVDLSDSRYRQNKVKRLKQISSSAPPKLKARSHHALALHYFWQQQMQKAFVEALNAKSDYQKLELASGLAIINDSLGNFCLSTGAIERALLFFIQSFVQKSRLDDRQGMALTLGNLARLCFQLGRFEQALDFAQQDIDLIPSEQVALLAVLHNLLARIYLADQQWQHAEDALAKAIQYAKEAGNSSTEWFCEKDFCQLQLAKNNLDAAQSSLEQLKASQGQLNRFQTAFLQLLECKLLHQRGQDAQAQIVAELEQLQETSLFELQIEFHLLLAKNVAAHAPAFTRDHLLLAKKRIKQSQQLRFMPELQRLMMEWQVHENIEEEIATTISTDINDNAGYIIRRVLGQGGFGTVSLAWDVQREQDVALKQFNLQVDANQQQVQQLWDQARLEFEAAARIKSSAVATPIAIGHDEFSAPYVVYQFIEGESLADFMQKISEPARILNYILQIARALASIHAEAIIHRDLKPANILIARNGSPVIIDLGIALLKSSAHKSSIAGTELYMAPEQKQSVAIDERADIYSLGCIFYQWLSGDDAFGMESKKGIFERLFSAKGSGINIDKDKIPKSFLSLIENMTAINPEQRPGNVSELVVLLEAVRS